MFKPAWWCLGAHAQTIFARFFRPFPKLDLNRKRLETPDSDFLDLDYLAGDKDSPVVVVLHGLEGSSKVPYVQSLLGELQKIKWKAVAVNYRGCSGEANWLKQSYHSGKTEDLDFVLKCILQEEKTNPIFLVGYSIGGNIILKWLGEQGKNVPPQIQKAVAVSVPYDLLRSVQVMDRGFNREIYTRKLLTTLKAKALAKEKCFPGNVDEGRVKYSKTFKDFDREVTAPLNGFKDEIEYWTQSSSLYYLDRIRLQTLLIHAKDDPFFPGSLLPLEQIKRSDYLKLVLTDKGGHLGFVSGNWPWKQELWLEKTITDFFASP